MIRFRGCMIRFTGRGLTTKVCLLVGVLGAALPPFGASATLSQDESTAVN